MYAGDDGVQEPGSVAVDEPFVVKIQAPLDNSGDSAGGIGMSTFHTTCRNPNHAGLDH
jgi:hypothetical protein